MALKPMGTLSQKSDVLDPPSLTDRLLDRWLAWRDGLTGSRTFRRWAAAFPLTRPIAQRRASGLFDLVAGFV